MAEMPMMASTSYASNTANLADMMQVHALVAHQLGQQQFQVQPAAVPQHQKKEVKAMAVSTSRRLVQIFIADPDENIPLEHCLLYSGEQKLTDLTDQELFFEIDIKSIMEEHNKKRVSFINKAVKERTEQLEPARIRDLKMTVVTVANF